MDLKKESFGQTLDGRSVEAFVFENNSGVKARVIDYGATIISVETPDRHGHLDNVVLGFNDMIGYQSQKNLYFGAICGRFANRIANGRFCLDETIYSLALNDQSVNSLHGGQIGFDKKVWDAEITGSAVRMQLVSPDGEEGYPGRLEIELLYSLNEEGELWLNYMARTNKKTVLNLTNHSYFNLAGSGTIYDHVIRIHADRYTVKNRNNIPTGELRPVADTVMDLRIPTLIGKNINSIPDDIGYDHNYCLNKTTKGEFSLAAAVEEPVSGRTLECWTTEPGVQFYTGNHLEGIKGRGGIIYKKHSGFCLESQHYPDSPNHLPFPSTELLPGAIYSQTCIYRFGVENY